MKKTIIILIISIFTINLFADQNIDQNIMNNLNNVSKEIINIMKENKYNKEKRNQLIINKITPLFDFKLMAKLSLGRNWKQLSTTEKKIFTSKYIKRMKESYSNKFDDYNNQVITIDKIITVKKNRKKVYTTIKNSNEKYKIVYKYYKSKKNNKWLIYDVEIEGVSIIKTDKYQFNEFLKSHNIQELIKKI